MKGLLPPKAKKGLPTKISPGTLLTIPQVMLNDVESTITDLHQAPSSNLRKVLRGEGATADEDIAWNVMNYHPKYWSACSKVRELLVGPHETRVATARAG